MAKPDDNPGFWCICAACGIQGPTRNTALQAVESARKMGWVIQAEFGHCPPCHHRMVRYERIFELPAASR